MAKKSNNEKERLFEEEFLPLTDALFYFAYGMTNDRTDAEDLVQETLIKAFRSLDRYKDETNARAWLFTICRNFFINDYRKKKRRPQRIEIEKVAYKESDDKPGLRGDYNFIFETEMGDEISTAMAQLSEEHRFIILLSDVGEFSYKEITEILEIPIGTVRGRLFRARNLLKDLLIEYAAKKYGIQDKRNENRKK